MPTTRAAARKADTNQEKSKPAQNSEKKRRAVVNTERDGDRVEIANDKRIKTSKDSSANGATIHQSSKRASEVASNIVEKGIIYFLTRGRVDTEEPENLSELQRTYLVLRPLPKDAKIGDGVIPDDPVCRLIAVPKKALPKSHQDRFMAFVEKTKTNMVNLKSDFFEGSEKETKTIGIRKTPPITVVGEGVYAITITGRTSHLAYILAIPSKPGEFQRDLGIRTKGSFIISLKNPMIKGPPNSQLPQTPDFPKAIMDDFRGLRWIPIQKTDHLDYPSAQLLLIGESQGDFKSAATKDSSNNKTNGKPKSPQKELERLEGEEEIRIEHLHGDSSIFDDLHIRQKDYPPLKSTW